MAPTIFREEYFRQYRFLVELLQMEISIPFERTVLFLNHMRQAYHVCPSSFEYVHERYMSSEVFTAMFIASFLASRRAGLYLPGLQAGSYLPRPIVASQIPS